MQKHVLPDDRLCVREENEFGVAYDPGCEQCRAEEAAEPVVRHDDPAGRANEGH